MRPKSVTHTCVGIVLCIALDADAIQPVEVGLEPLHHQFREVQEQMYALADQFSSYTATASRRSELGRQLVQLQSERKTLEAEIRTKKHSADIPNSMKNENAFYASHRRDGAVHR